MQLLLLKSIKEKTKRKKNLEKRVEKEHQKIAKRIKRENEEMDNEIENFMTVGNTLLTIMEDKQRSTRSANEIHDRSMWERGYSDFSNKKFKQSLQITRESFELILEEISMDLNKALTPVKPNPIPLEIQLTLILYFFAHGCSLSTLEDVFGYSNSTKYQTFNHVCRILVQRL